MAKISPNRSTARGPLRVLVASPLGRGGQGGIDRVMDNLATTIDAAGGALDGGEVLLRVRPTRGMGPALTMLPLMARFVAALAAGRVTRGLDLVHINVAQRGSIRRKALLAQACDALGLPYVLHVHGSQFHDSWTQGSAAMQARMRRMIGHAARIIVLGTFWHDFLVRTGADPARLVIVPNATVHPPVANVHDGDRPARILFLGKMGPRKGVPQLVEALSLIADRADWHATLAGNGAVEETRADVARRGLAARVDVLGWAGPEDVARMLAGHEVLVLPSFNENLPMSVIEGLAHGMAVVATPVGAVADIVVDGDSGLLVPPGDAPALAEALRRCVADPGLRAALGARARAYHRLDLDLANYAGRVVAVWRAALDDRRV